MSTASLDPEVLLRYDGFVRAVARAVLADATDAEDLAQQALLSALKHRPALARSPRAWLATIVRNLASKMRRDDARRRAREARAARPELVPSAQEVLALEDSRRAVVEAVLALDQPQRDVLLLRWFDDLKPRAIAKRLGIPVTTVHTRTKRALARLRARFAAEGDGRGLLALVPLAKLEALSLGVAAKAKLAAAGVAAAACLVWAVTGRGPGVADELVELTGADAIRVAAAESGAERAATTRPDEPLRVADAAASAPSVGFGSLHVRVTWAEDGTAAADVGAEIVEWGGASELGVRRRIVRTDGYGALVLADVRSGAVRVNLDRGTAGSATVTPGGKAQMTLAIPRGLEVRGVVADANGAPVAGARIWMSRRGYDDVMHEAACAADDGTFRVRCLPSGTLLGARASGHAPSRLQPIEGPSGTTLELRLVVGGPGGGLCGKVVDPHGEPVAGALVIAARERPANGTWPASGIDATVPADRAMACSDARGRYALLGLDVGPHRVVALADGGQAARAVADVAAGAPTALELRLGRGVVVLGAARMRDGKPLPGLLVSAVVQELSFQPLVRTGADGEFRLAALPPGEILLRVDSRSCGRFERKLSAREGAVLRWDVVLDPPLQVRGRVLDEAGRPLAGWHLRLTSEGVLRSGEYDVGRETSDADGRFAFGCRFEHAHRIEVTAPEGQSVPSKILKGVRPGERELEVRIARAEVPSVGIRGRIVDAAGRPQPGARIKVEDGTGERGIFLTPQGADGSFAFGKLVPEQWSVQVAVQGLGEVRRGPKRLEGTDVWDLGTIVLGDDGTVSIGVTREPGTESAKPELTIVAGEQTVASTLAGELASKDGRLISRPLPVGDYELRIAGGITARDRVPFTVASGKATLVEAVVRRGFSRRVVVREPRPEPGAGTARLVVRAQDGRVLVDQTLWRQAKAELQPFVMQATGWYEISVSTPEGRSGSARVWVDEATERARPAEIVLR